MAEWFKAAVLKTVVRKYRGFESYFLRQKTAQGHGRSDREADGARLLSECGGKTPPRVRIPPSPPRAQQRGDMPLITRHIPSSVFFPAVFLADFNHPRPDLPGPSQLSHFHGECSPSCRFYQGFQKLLRSRLLQQHRTLDLVRCGC
jgi:hypothetical protein